MSQLTLPQQQLPTVAQPQPPPQVAPPPPPPQIPQPPPAAAAAAAAGLVPQLPPFHPHPGHPGIPALQVNPNVATVAAPVIAVGPPQHPAQQQQQQQQHQQQQQVPPAAAAAQQPAPAAAAPAPTSSKPRNRSWDENYAELLMYKATHNGSTDVPLSYKNDRILGKWVAHLREHQNAAALSQERRDALNAIGFVWSPHEEKWNAMYKKLCDFKLAMGHCKVPTNWKPDRKLGKWVMRQREKRKNNLMPDHRLEKLEAVGFVWKIYAEPKTRKSTIIDERWNARYQELVDYAKEHGHANVRKDDGPLGKWVQEQRVMYQRKLLKPERQKLLEDIGFIFAFRAQKSQHEWNQMFETLKACSTTTDDGQFKILGMDTGLSRWVHRQKESYRIGRMDKGREILLRKIGFQFPERVPMYKPAPAEGTATAQVNAMMMVNNPTAAVAAAEAVAATTAGLPGATTTGLPGACAVAGLPGAAGLPGVAGLPGATAAAATAAAAATTTTMAQPKMDLPAPAVAPAAPPAPIVTEAEGRQIGMKLEEGIAVVAKFMAITPKELSLRLALQKTQAKQMTKRRASPRKKAAAKKAAAPKKKASKKLSTPSPDTNAFCRLLPLILEVYQYSDDEEVMQEACRHLQNFIRSEKGWNPRKTDGNMYNQLLGMAAELGILLDPNSERCQSVVTSVEYQLKKVLNLKRQQLRQAKWLEENQIKEGEEKDEDEKDDDADDDEAKKEADDDDKAKKEADDDDEAKKEEDDDEAKKEEDDDEAKKEKEDDDDDEDEAKKEKDDDEAKKEKDDDDDDEVKKEEEGVEEYNAEEDEEEETKKPAAAGMGPGSLVMDVETAEDIFMEKKEEEQEEEKDDDEEPAAKRRKIEEETTAATEMKAEEQEEELNEMTI